jgi:hypothetical protein
VDADVVAVLKGLAALPGNPTTRTVAAEADLDPPAAEDVLAALAVVGFVKPAGPGRWRAHPRLRGSDATLVLGNLADFLEHGRPMLVEAAPPPQPVVPAPEKPKQLSAAAHELGVHPETLDVWAKQGLVPFTWTAGGRRRFLVSEIQAHLQRRAAA